LTPVSAHYDDRRKRCSDPAESPGAPRGASRGAANASPCPRPRLNRTVDGSLVANTEFPHTVPIFFELEGLSCGYDFAAPAAEDYKSPFAFNGIIHSVTIDVSGELISDDEAEMARMLAQQ
jgi:hypothetical protein